MSTYVPVLVPEESLAKVYRVLGDLPEESSGDEVAHVASGPNFWRTPDAIKNHLLTRPQSIRGLAKYLAERPDQDVKSEDAAAALNLPYGWNSLAGALGAFGNYCAPRGLDFPWTTRVDEHDSRVRLRLDAETAAVFLKYL